MHTCPKSDPPRSTHCHKLDFNINLLYFTITLYCINCEMPQETTRHGPFPSYESKEAKYEAKKARQRQRYQRRQASQRNRVFDNTFSGPAEPFLPTSFNLRQLHEVPADASRPTIDDEFLPQFDDEIEEFLPPLSPSLGSISMDISELSEPEEII